MTSLSFDRMQVTDSEQCGKS